MSINQSLAVSGDTEEGTDDTEEFRCFPHCDYNGKPSCNTLLCTGIEAKWRREKLEGTGVRGRAMAVSSTKERFGSG